MFLSSLVLPHPSFRRPSMAAMREQTWLTRAFCRIWSFSNRSSHTDHYDIRLACRPADFPPWDSDRAYFFTLISPKDLTYPPFSLKLTSFETGRGRTMMLDRFKANLKSVIENLLMTLGLDFRPLSLPRFGKIDISERLNCLFIVVRPTKPDYLWKSAKFSLGGLLRKQAAFPSGFA